MKKRIVIIIVGLVLIILAIGSYEVFSRNQAHQEALHSVQQKTPIVIYKGENGKDALMLLKQSTSIEQDHSGLVVSINGRKADNSKHEYWAFYVNGKYSSVGPAAYKTKNSDVITWKIEKY